MQTVKYDKQDIVEITEFLVAAENTVDLTPDFFELANSIAEADVEKLSKLLSRKYTITAREGGEIYGLASMDGEGNVGLLYVRNDVDLKKTSRALLRALEKRAEKKDISQLSALSTERSSDVLTASGFEAYDSQVGDEALMVKRIISKDSGEFSSDKVKRYSLDPSKPIVAEGAVPWWPSLLFGISCLFVAILAGIYIGNHFNPSGAFGNGNINIFIAVVGVFFVVSLTLFIFFAVKKRKVKKEILSMQITNAVIVSDVSCVQNYRRQDGRDEKTSVDCSFNYSYYDSDMQSHTHRFHRKYQNKAPYFYKGQELIVACSGDKCYILKKYSFAEGESLLDLAPYDEEETLGIDSKAISPQEAERANLTPIEASPVYFLYPASIFAMLAVIAAVVVIAALTIKAKTGYASSLIWVFLAVCTVILGAIGGYYIARPLRALKKYKSLRRGNVRYVKGKLACEGKTYSNKSKQNFYCVFKTGYGQEKRVDVKSYCAASRLRKGEDEVVVAYDDSDAVALVPKESLSQAMAMGRRKNNL